MTAPRGSTYKGWWVDTENGTYDLYYGSGGASDPVEVLRANATSVALLQNMTPASSDGAALGTAALPWSDLHLASGGVINWANGDTITHSANALTLAGIATLTLPTTWAMGVAAGANTWTAQSLSLTGANSTNNTTLTVTNSSNAAAASHSIVDVAVGGTTSQGDPQVRLTIPSGTSWHIGVDNSNADIFLIGTGTAVGSARMFAIDPRTTTSAVKQVQVVAVAAAPPDGATSTITAFDVEARTYTFAGTTTVTTLLAHSAVNALTAAQSGGAVTVNKATGLSVIGVTAGASVTLTHSSGIRTLTGGAAVNVSGIYHETQTAGTTGNYQSLYAVSTGARPALADHASIQAVDFATGDTRLMIQGELGIEIAIGNSTIQPNSTTEMAFCVTNEALTVGAEGSVVIPYRSTTDAAFDDTAGGNVNGAIGIQYDSDTGPTSTIEVRSNGAWVSVAVSGYLMQNKVEFNPKLTNTLHHAKQVYQKGGRWWIDESKCFVCGEAMKPGEQSTFWGNYARDNGLHNVFGHLHVEKDAYVQGLERRVVDLEKKLARRKELVAA